MIGNLENSHPDIKGIALTGRDQAILCFHGFTATPQTFSSFAQKANKELGFEINAPLLSGHGTRYESLDEVNFETWIQDAKRFFNELDKRYEKIHLVGLSLGGVLALLLAFEFSNRVASLNLLAPGLYLSNKKHEHQLRWAQFLPAWFLKKRIHVKQSLTPNHISYDRYSVYAALEIYKILKRTQKQLHPFSVPCLIQYPDRDPVVDPNSSKNIFSFNTHPDSKLIEFNSPHHIMLESPHKEEITQNIITFIKNHS